MQPAELSSIKRPCKQGSVCLSRLWHWKSDARGARKCLGIRIKPDCFDVAMSLFDHSDKASKANVHIQFDQGFAGNLPYREQSFDRVFSSFVFHHLLSDERLRMLSETRRVLKPSGEFHMLDFEGPGDSSHGVLAHLFHSNQRLKDNSEIRVLDLMRQAGFTSAAKLGRRNMLFGGSAYYRASIV